MGISNVITFLALVTVTVLFFAGGVPMRGDYAPSSLFVWGGQYKFSSSISEWCVNSEFWNEIIK